MLTSVAGLLGDIHYHDVHNVAIHPELMLVEYLSLRDYAEQGHNRLVQLLGHDEHVAHAEDKQSQPQR